MRHDLVIRQLVRGKVKSLATEMLSWEALPRIDADEEERIQQAIQPYQHTTKRDQLIIGGVDGTGDFPSLSYGDSFVYVTLAQGTRYQSDRNAGLKEIAPELDPLIEFTWLPEDDEKANAALDAAFERLAGLPVKEVIRRSDYRKLKRQGGSRTSSVDGLFEELVRPHATDSGNVAIQLRSTAELGAALRLVSSDPKLDYVLLDSTFSLPFVSRIGLSLFFEHLKRLCCVEALSRKVGFFALSKSHGLPAIEHIERLAVRALGLDEKAKPEHWFMRIPTKERDGWELSLLENRNVPPVATVSYLVRFHKNTPIMRLDVDEGYWLECVQGSTSQMTLDNERSIFEDLDYASHDQRAYGYPYPIKAGHDRASLTQAERVALRKMIVEAAVSEGMRPQLFRNVSQATGHG